MGRDIHIHVVKDGKKLTDDLFDGRNSEWFDNMAGRGYDDEYDHLPVEYGMCPEADEDFKSLENEQGYFDFRYIKVKDFIDWYNKYLPCLHAGYFSEYDIWRMKYKGYIPEDAPTVPCPEEGATIFSSYKDPYDCSTHIRNALVKPDIPDDAYLCYCFDW